MGGVHISKNTFGEGGQTEFYLLIYSIRHLFLFFVQFVTSPLCCPSRSSILTGQYVHNHHAKNNSISGGCSSPGWQAGPEKHSVSTYLKDLGYRTFFSGKYLNQYGRQSVGGPEHVPPGWDEWLGLVGNSRYYNYTLSANGKPVKHGDTYSADYLTDILVSTAEIMVAVSFIIDIIFSLSINICY